MSTKAKNELLPRIGKLLAIIVVVCVAIVLIYFLVLLSTGKIQDFNKNESSTSQQAGNQSIKTMYGDITKIDSNKMDFKDSQGSQIQVLQLADSVMVDQYDPYTNSNNSIKEEDMSLPTKATLTILDDKVINISVLPAISISGEVINNQADVLTVRSDNIDYTVRSDARTRVVKQNGDGTTVDDLSMSVIQTGDIVSVISDSAAKIDSRSFNAAVVNIFSKQ